VKPGRKPAPAVVKEAKGNPGRRRIGADPVDTSQTGGVAPPSWLKGDALAVWNRLAPNVARLKLLTPVDAESFARYCRNLSRWLKMQDVLDKEGETYVPLDPAKTYSLVSNNYMRNGGDGYDVFKEKGENAYDYGPGLETVLADYLAAHQPFKPYTDGRITEVASAAGAAATEAKPAAGTDTTATQPAATSGAATASAASGPQKHVIAKGDTLWDLAKSFYGEGALWKKISEANGKPAPRALHVGTELEIPAK